MAHNGTVAMAFRIPMSEASLEYKRLAITRPLSEFAAYHRKVTPASPNVAKIANTEKGLSLIS